MRQEFVNGFLIQNAKCFSPAVIGSVEKDLERIDDSKYPVLLGVNFWDPTLILIIAIFFGIDRFFLGDIALGILKIITCYGVGIWWIVDIFTAYDRTRRYNYGKFQEAIAYCR